MSDQLQRLVATRLLAKGDVAAAAARPATFLLAETRLKFLLFFPLCGNVARGTVAQIVLLPRYLALRGWFAHYASAARV